MHQADTDSLTQPARSQALDPLYPHTTPFQQQTLPPPQSEAEGGCKVLGDDRHTSCPTVTLGRKTTDAKTFLDRLHDALSRRQHSKRDTLEFHILAPKGPGALDLGSERGAEAEGTAVHASQGPAERLSAPRN